MAFEEKLWAVGTTDSVREPVSAGLGRYWSFGRDAGSVPSWLAVKTHTHFQKGKDAEPRETGEFIQT